MSTNRATPATGRDLSKSRILVTGGSGFIGSHLCERLVARGASVGVLARTPRLLEGSPAYRRCDFIAHDLRNQEASTAAIAAFRPDVLVHLAARPDGREDCEQANACTQTNVLGTLAALEGLRRAGGALLVYGDSTKVYGNAPVPYHESMPLAPTSSYAIAKAAGWQLCQLHARLHGTGICAVRPTIVYGPRQGFNLFTFVAEAVRRGAPEVQLDGGEQTRDPLYIDDAIDAYVAVIEAGDRVLGRAINIGGGRERTVSELAALVVRQLGGTQRVIGIAAQARPTEIWRSWCDNREAEALIGWRPRVGLDEGLRTTLSALGYDLRPADAAVLA
jgi:nucleoside-diphosphate-sugar epimerase